MALVDQVADETFTFTETQQLNGDKTVTELFNFTDTTTFFVVGSFPWVYPFTAEIRDTRSWADIARYNDPNGTLLQ